MPWSARAGAQVALHLSAGCALHGVGVSRIDLPDPVALHWPVQPTAEAPAPRTFTQGSFLRLETDTLPPLRSIGFEVMFTRNTGPRCVLACGPLRLIRQDAGVQVLLDGLPQGMPLVVPDRCWLSVDLRAEAGDIGLTITGHDPLAPLAHDLRVAAPWPALAGPLRLGSSGAADAPTLSARFAAVRIDTAAGNAAWTFPTLLPEGPVLSQGDLPGVPLYAENLPTFCVTSRRWDGSTFDPRVGPGHYDAVHCHDDDMAALDWPASFTLTLPAEVASGIYAFDVAHAGGTAQVVFMVAASQPTAPLLFLAPTATYLAYADEALPPHLYDWRCDDAGHRFAVDNRLKSLYDYHTDGSGVSICSWRRPKTTLRADYLYPLCGAAHGMPVDLHLLRFCHRHGIAFDLITDHDLHAGGTDLLAGWRVVMTGSHPEYVSAAMDDALRAFLAQGGSLAYLGGNGFAGVVAFQGDLMELRRGPAETGRTWDGPLAEQALAITNAPGGHLRAQGRGEFSLVGGAISLMGFGPSLPFRRTAESRDPAVCWLFDGIAGDTFGDSGIVLGGAAGYEVDATDPQLGTHPDTRVIARADGFPPDYPQDASRWYEGGAAEAASRRCAEMTLRHLASGGMIFSASSVAFCGALPAAGAQNDVGRLTLNLLNRMQAGPADGTTTINRGMQQC